MSRKVSDRLLVGNGQVSEVEEGKEEGNRCHETCRVSSSEEKRSIMVNLGSTSHNIYTLGMVAFNMQINNEESGKREMLCCIKANILECNIDLIIGLQDIRKYDLVRKIKSFFGSATRVEASINEAHATPALECHSDRKGCCHRDISFESLNTSTMCALCQEGMDNNFAYRKGSSPKLNPKACQQLCILANLQSKNDLLEYASDNDDIIWKDNPFEESEESTTVEEMVNKIHLEGPLSLQEKLKATCTEFSDIFAESVRKDPADLPPMELHIDLEKWRSHKNRGPPRVQSVEKNNEISTQVRKLLDLAVVEPSTAAEYSQVHLVPKPDGKWRFCLDYVRLNDATIGAEGWPIPNISQMIHRIGARKAKYFAVMDMTSGYHQAPLAKSSMIFTAFMCFMGIFHWLRVPMGLKGAGSYFQRVMATIVLVGLMYIICELYIDDVLIFGNTEDEFVSNIRQVFARFRKFNVTANPKKCRLGMSEVEYVGHVFNEEGVTFTQEKREKVLNFPLPETHKSLLSFIGLVNYFREHVPKLSVKLKPLRDMIEHYDRKKRLEWTPLLEALYHELQTDVANCAALFFVDDNAPVVVMTDASDYGIGAYIYQVVDEKEKPIAFMSKVLGGAQLNWSTPEKEAYAIFATFTKHEHLLRDRKFLLRTDHKNLTFINMEGSPKIRRWKIFLQEFNYDIEHVAGENNIVADHFSRLCALGHTWDVPEGMLANALPKKDMRIPNENYVLIGRVHNSEVGHVGVEKTIARLHEGGHKWPYLRKMVKQFVRNCPCCQKLSHIKLPIHTHPFTRAAYEPMEILNIDAVGPLQEDKFGNCHILVVIDCFTRWVELYPVPDTSALSAARALLQHCGRYGVPALIRSDRGSQFVNEIIKDLCTLLNTDQELSVAYSKEENAIVERMNKEVLRHLRALLLDSRIYTKWSMDQLPLVMRILNSQEKEATGVSPAELLFGNTVHIGRCMLTAPKHDSSSGGSETSTKKLSDHMETLLERQSMLLKVAQETQDAYDTHHMSEYSKEFTEFPINSYVLWNHPEGPRHKLKTPNRGPFQVVNILGSEYVIQDLISGKNVNTHISNLRPFHYDVERTDPKDVAMHDVEEFLIDSILDHRGDRTRRKTMEFKVHWKDYSSEHDSWEPYANLRDTEQLLKYLSENRLKSLIGNKHK